MKKLEIIRTRVTSGEGLSQNPGNSNIEETSGREVKDKEWACPAEHRKLRSKRAGTMSM